MKIKDREDETYNTYRNMQFIRPKMELKTFKKN